MERRWLKILASSLLLTLAVPGSEAAYSGRISLDRKDAIYKVGETAVCKVTLLEDKKPLVGAKARMTVKWETKVVETRDFETTGKPVEFSYRADRPGWVYFGVELLGENGKVLRGKGVFKHRAKPTIVTEIGALFDPEKILSPVREPADFDEFWVKRRAELAGVPLKPELEELYSGAPGVKLFSVTLPCPRGITATGYLAYPENAAPKSLPGYVFFQSHTNADAPSNIAVAHAKRGMLAFSASWHGFPTGRDKQFYVKELPAYYQGGLKNIGDREKWVYSDLFFRVMRELEFVKSRPEWDGRTLAVVGGSLGGAQAAAAAGLDKDVTLAVVSVPGGCEFAAYEAGRRSGGAYKKVAPEKLRQEPSLAGEGLYYDAVNFGRRIKCETFVCTGFVDETCYPSNVYAFYNAIPATTKKTMSTNPRTGHFGTTRNVDGDRRLKELFKSVTIGELPKDNR